MDFNLVTHLKTCSDFIAYSNPVSLILYSHIPSALVALLVGVLILIKNRTILGKIFFTLSILFSAWVLLDLVVWLSTNSVLTMFSWSLFWLVTGMISVSAFYFFYVFVKKEDLGLIPKIILFLLILPIIVLTPTKYNLIGFNVPNCEAIENSFYVNYYFALGLVAIVAIFLLLIFSWKKIQPSFRKEVALMTLGIELFLISFFSLSYVASYFDNYNVEFYGLFGMTIFMALLAYIIVKFKAFNLRLIGANVLVVTLWILIGSLFFVAVSNTTKIVVIITEAIAVVFGWMLIRSIRREVAQRERIEKLAGELQSANTKLKALDVQKSEFLSFATHQLRAPMTAIKGYASMILEGSFGSIGKESTEAVRVIYQSSQKLISIIEDFLNISRIELGTIQYNFVETDLGQLVNDVVKQLEPIAEAHQLKLISHVEKEKKYLAALDSGKISQVINNLIDNAIKYTPSGSITVSLKHLLTKIRVEIKDTGLGIDEETKERLFKKFSRAKDASKVNVTGTGLGLYVAQQMVIAHGGEIWVESDGRGHGSTFIFELPVKK